MTAALFFGFGILLNQRFVQNEIGWETLLITQAIVLVAWFLFARVSLRAGQYLVCLLLIVSGASWHHYYWNLASPDHIHRLAGEDSTAVSLEGRLLTRPVFETNSLPSFASAFPKDDRTRCEVRAIALRTSKGSRPVSGKVRLTVSGELNHVQRGDRVLIHGMLRNFEPNRNPAVYDFASSMRRQGILSSIFCRHADAVELLALAETTLLSGFSNGLSQLRSHIRETFRRVFPAREAAIASALILGERTEVDEAVMRAFRKSGLMHLLSISGLHVALIGAIACGLACLWGGSPRTIQLMTIGGITGAWLLAELRPPVFRAWLLGVFFCWSWFSCRRSRSVQALGLAAFLCLIVNPGWLFETGAQLSFLAIVAILGCLKWMPGLFRKQESEIVLPSEKVSTRSSRWQAGLRSLLKYGRETILLSLGITLFLMPLLARQFQLVSLAGIPATVLALALLFLALPLLLVTALLGFVSAPLAMVVARPTGWVLQAMADLAEWFSVGGLQWIPVRPHLWTLVGLGIMALLFIGLPAAARSRWKAGLLLGWTGLLIWGLSPWSYRLSSQDLECRLLSVGHGNACLMRCPNGMSILFDGGSMENGWFASQAIKASLCDLGCNRLDAIVISHTDSDHLNAVPFLLEELPVHSVLLNPVGLNPDHSGLAAILERRNPELTDLRLLHPDDRIVLDEDVTIRVLQGNHAPIVGPASDNERSLVIEVQYAGRSILLPGDVSGDGQETLRESNCPDSGYDLVVAPHHGSLKDNGNDFATWAMPGNVIFSTGDRDEEEALRAIYSRANLFWTSEGAVRMLISPDGPLTFEQWSQDQSWERNPAE